MERMLIAILVSGLGFFTGLLTVYSLSRLPGIEMSQFIYLSVAAIISLSCGVYGFFQMDKTIVALGKIWTVMNTVRRIGRLFQ